MPTPTSIIESVQRRFDSQTWADKPDVLWFGEAWPTDAGGTRTQYPVLFFESEGTPHDTTFPHVALQHWGFRFYVLADTVQTAEACYRGVMWDGQTPEATAGGTGYGFWTPPSVTLPTGYVFKHFRPNGPFKIDVLKDQMAPSGVPTVRLTWAAELYVHFTG